MPFLPKLVVWVVLAFFLLWVGTSLYLHDKPYYAISPGDALPVRSLITVPAHDAHPLQGKILLTDVLLGPVTATQLPGDLLNPYVDLEPAVDVLGPGVTLSEYAQESTVEMSSSQDDAKIAALRHLAAIPAVGTGALVVGYIPGTPAASWVQSNDVIMAVNGQPVSGPKGLTKIVDSFHAGDTITLTVENALNGTAHSVRTRLVPGTAQTVGVGRPFIGVEIFTQPVDVHRLPFSISINSDQIGGPSAGLAFTLGLIDTLSNGNLTGGKIVAATGTIDPQGNIGPIGGLPQKAVAVREAHASVFFVPYGQPPSDYTQAASNVEGKVKIIKVHNLTEVLRDLARMGGDMGGVSIPPDVPAAGSSPSAGNSP